MTLIAYKGRPSLGAPRTEPYGRNSRIRLPPWVFDAEALSGPGMGYPGFGQPAVRQSVHVCPRRSILLAAPAQGAAPEFDDMVTECREGTTVGGHGVVGEEAPHHRPQPSSLFRDVLVPASPKVLTDFQQLRLLPVTPRVSSQQKAAPPRSWADMGEAEVVEGLRSAIPSCGPIGRGMSAELNQPGFVGVQLQVEFRHPDAQVCQESLGIGSVFKTNDDVVGVSHHDHRTSRMTSQPLFGPQIVDVMKIDVRQQRRDDSPLRGALRHRLPYPFLHHAGFQPFTNQA